MQNRFHVKLIRAAAILIAGGSIKLGAATLNVPSQYSTIQAAYDSPACGAGDTILVADGVYSNQQLWLTKSGTATAPITIQAATTGGAVLDGGNGTGAHGQTSVVYISGGNYNVIQGFEIKNGLHGGVTLYGSHNQILNNNIHDNGLTYSLSNQGQDGIFSDSSVSDNSYMGNFVWNNGRFGLTPNNLDHGLYLTANNELVANNIIVSNASCGIQVVGYPTVSNMKIYNNTIAWNRDGSAIRLHQGINGVDIANNIIYGDRRSSTCGIKDDGATGGGVVVRNNLFYFNVTDYCFTSTTPDIQPNNQFSDPQFVDSASDWHLQSSSPAIDSGVTLSSVTTDFDGVTRPQGSAYDIGAFEFSPSGGVTRNVPSQYATIQAAYDASGAGDTIVVANGTYTEHLSFNKSGAPGSSITIQAANIGAAILDGQNTTANSVSNVIQISGSYNIVKGFEVKNGQVGGIAIFPDASNNPGRFNQLIKNIVHDNGGVYNGPNPQCGISTSTNTSDTSCLDNYIHDNGRISLGSTVDHGLYLAGDNEVAVNNLLVANCEYGIQVTGKSTVSNAKIYNNVFVSNRSGSGMMLWLDVNGVDIANNIFYGNAGYGIKTSSCTGSGVNIRNNLFYGNRDGTWAMTENGSTVSYTTSNNITTADPMFVNNASDWHLQSGSVAINAGTWLDIVTTDYDDVARPQGSAFDIGAYER